VHKTLSVALVAFGFAGSLWADDPMTGTWKLNLAKSKIAPMPPGQSVKEETLTVAENGDKVMITLKRTRDDGSVMLLKFSTPKGGGPVEYIEGAPPAGISEVSKKIDDRTLDMTMSRNGKVIRSNHATVSADGKTVREVVKGVDAQGKPEESLFVFDRQ
jgi:hypothetical protein